MAPKKKRHHSREATLQQIKVLMRVPVKTPETRLEKGRRFVPPSPRGTLLFNSLSMRL